MPSVEPPPHHHGCPLARWPRMAVRHIHLRLLCEEQRRGKMCGTEGSGKRRARPVMLPQLPVAVVHARVA